MVNQGNHEDIEGSGTGSGSVKKNNGSESLGPKSYGSYRSGTLVAGVTPSKLRGLISAGLNFSLEVTPANLLCRLLASTFNA